MLTARSSSSALTHSNRRDREREREREREKERDEMKRDAVDTRICRVYCMQLRHAHSYLRPLHCLRPYTRKLHTLNGSAPCRVRRHSPTNFHRRESTVCDSSPTVLLSFLSEILNSPSSIPVTLASSKSLYTPREVPYRLCSMKQRFIAASCSFTARDN